MRYLVLFLLLAGCATQEQQAEKLAAKYGPFCEKLGFQRDTNPWRDCLIKQQSIALQY